jgi:hypothetical protein
MQILKEVNWDILLDSIAERRVIPIIGPGLITSGTDDVPITFKIAGSLAKHFGIDGYGLPLSDVVTKILGSHMASTRDVYTLVNRLQSELPRLLPEHLLKIARISHFNLFMTTTFDSMLEESINHERFEKACRTKVAKFSLRKWADIPDWATDLDTTLYYLHGRSSVVPRSFAIWDADAIDFTLCLHDLLKDGKSLPCLHDALKTHDLLLLGVNLTDWLARFFLRVIRQDNPMADPDYAEYLAESELDVSDSFVTYCGSARRGTHILAYDPVAFINELYDRWSKRFSDGTGVAPSAFSWPAKEMPTGAIFVSYAHEDVNAALCLVESLRQGGCDVWLDRDRLNSGEDWENTLESQVKWYCSVFISVISVATESGAGYCHRERKWAVERDPDFGQGGCFYVPIIIDKLEFEGLKREHRPKRSVNVSNLPDGRPSLEFVNRMRELQALNMKGLGR